MDSDEHRRPGKNGVDHKQDRELRDLRERFDRWQHGEDEWRKADHAVHEHLIRSVTRQNVLVGVASAILSALIAWLGALWIKIDNVETRLETQHADDQKRNDAHIYKGEQWGKDLENGIERNRQRMRELENRLFGRGKQE